MVMVAKIYGLLPLKIAPLICMLSMHGEVSSVVVLFQIEDFRDDRRKLSEAVEEMVDRVEYKQKVSAQIS